MGEGRIGRITYPEEASVVAPIPGARVKHIWSENAADYSDDVATTC
jgi:hypothetical protein